MPESARRFLAPFLGLLLPPRRTEAIVERLRLAYLQELACGEALPYREKNVRALIWEVKYRANRHALALAGAFLAEELFALASEEISRPLLIPVPMHAARRIQRGWNQTELLCEAALAALGAEQKELRRGLRSVTARGLSDFLAEKSRTPEELLFAQLPYEYAPTVLVRTRATVPQQGLPKFIRLKNVKNSMRVAKPELVVGRVCVVVDDVTTTGATLAECKRALRAAGARAVHTISLARS
jgi:predicted amidophosphoribosyltransferase